MQTKICDFENKIDYKIKYKRIKFIVLGFFLILFSLFSAKYIFADINVNFEKTSYKLMENTSTKIGYEIFNNSTQKVDLLVWSECDSDDIICDYSKRITLFENSSQTGSFYVTGIDDSRGYITLYVNNLRTNETKQFRIDVEVLYDEEEGFFEIDVYNSNLCIGKTNKLSLEIKNNTTYGLYNLFLTNNVLEINQNTQNPVYLNNKTIVDYYVFVPENTIENDYFNLIYTIENEKVQETKKIKVYTRNCPDTFVDFSVTGSSIATYYLNKTEEKTIEFTIKNNSYNNKTIYISEEHENDDVFVTINRPQITLSSNATQKIEVTFKTTEDTKSGSYDVSLYFYDGINFITKKIRLIINPQHRFETESINAMSQTMVIGRNLELLLIIKNKGDIREEFTITTTVDNDIKLRASESVFYVQPYSNNLYSVLLSSGTNTVPGYAYLRINIDGTNSNYHEEMLYIINVVRDVPIVSLEFLSFPKKIDVFPNTIQTIDFVLKNKGETKIIIDRIDITGVSQEIILSSLKNIEILPNETKIITITLDVKEITQNQKAKIIFTTNTQNVLEKEIEINVFETKLSEKTKSGITGFFNLKTSVITGVIVACLVVIILFVLGIFKSGRI